MEYLCVSSFSFFLSRLVVSTVVTALTVHASQPHNFYTTHYSYNTRVQAQRKKYTRARGKLGLLAASPDSRCTHATCPEPPIDPDPSWHAKTARNREAASRSQKRLPGTAGRGRWAAREVAGGQRRAAARREPHGAIRRRDNNVTRRSRRRRSPGPSNPEPRAGRPPAH